MSPRPVVWHASAIVAREQELLALAVGDEHKLAWITDLLDVAEALLEDERLERSLWWVGGRRDVLAEVLERNGRPAPRPFLPPDRALIRCQRERAKRRRDDTAPSEEERERASFYAADPETTVPLNCPRCGAPVGGRFNEHQCPRMAYG
jgi:hypothetical protein